MHSPAMKSPAWHIQAGMEVVAREHPFQRLKAVSRRQLCLSM